MTGDLYSKRGDLEKTIEYYRKVLALYPERLDVLNKIAATYTRVENYDKALLSFKKTVTLVPEKPEGYYNVACMYSRLNETTQALKWIKMAVEKGYKKWELIKTDPDLENLRKTADYQQFAKGK